MVRKRRPSDNYPRGSRSLVQFYVPHPRSRPCRRCRRPTDPLELADVAQRTGSGVDTCVACVQVMLAEIQRERRSEPTYLDRLGALLERAPGLVRERHDVEEARCREKLLAIADHQRRRASLR